MTNCFKNVIEEIKDLNILEFIFLFVLNALVMSVWIGAFFPSEFITELIWLIFLVLILLTVIIMAHRDGYI